MAKLIKVKLNRKGVRELLKSAEAAGACEAEAQQIASEMGEGFSVVSVSHKDRNGAGVSANTREAMKKVYNNELLDALHSRRID